MGNSKSADQYLAKLHAGWRKRRCSGKPLQRAAARALGAAGARLRQQWQRQHARDRGRRHRLPRQLIGQGRVGWQMLARVRASARLCNPFYSDDWPYARMSDTSFVHCVTNIFQVVSKFIMMQISISTFNTLITYVLSQQ